MQLLCEGTRGHQLLLPARRGASCLHKAESDPLMFTADILAGQPDPDAVAEARNLKWIQISSSSITRYDNPAFRALVTARNIAVCNSASVYSEACAEHALTFMLAQSRLLPRSLGTRVAGGTNAWDQLRRDLIPLRGQTVLIVGYGAIGQRLTEMLAPFTMQIIALRRVARGNESVPVITQDQLAGALSTADHVINILPDSEQTREFFDAARFAHMNGTGIFYNIGRGTTVDQEALLEVLRQGRIKAAWLDVTNPEPLPDNHPLFAQPNCFITPHVAGGHQEESVTFVRHFLANLNRLERGEPLLDRVM
jgi:phosphoglycerate dehydrogenase-like enzyme